MSEVARPNSEIAKGKILLLKMSFSTNNGGHFGFPKYALVPSATRAKSDEEIDAIMAFLNTTKLIRDTDYQWSYWNQGERGVLNLKEAAWIQLSRMLNAESPGPGIERS